MAGQWDVAISEAAKLALAVLVLKKESDKDHREGRVEIAERKERLLKEASDAWDRGDLSACADFLAGVYDIAAGTPNNG